MYSGNGILNDDSAAGVAQLVERSKWPMYVGKRRRFEPCHLHNISDDITLIRRGQGGTFGSCIGKLPQYKRGARVIPMVM